jgi:hypothetical protein
MGHSTPRTGGPPAKGCAGRYRRQRRAAARSAYRPSLDPELTVRHTRNHHTVRPHADYVTTSTGLGYATTIHAAQGVIAHTMHGLLTDQESRQQLYTMLTRGRAANHLYLQVVGDGDPDTLIRPDSVAPAHPDRAAPTDTRSRRHTGSATTLLRQLSDPAARLFDAVQRYTDGLHVAAEQLVGPQIVQMLDGQAEPSWPTLRAHLLALAAETGEHPLLHLHTAAAGRDLQTAGDMAAVLDWRLPERAATGPGPLPWLPGIPQALHDHHVWGEYLAKRSQLVIGLADQVRDCASHSREQPVWAPPGSHPTGALLRELAVWRAAVGVDPKPADQPEQHGYKRHPPYGNRTSTETLPYAVTALAQMQGNARLADPLEITSAKIDIACLQHTLFVGVSLKIRILHLALFRWQTKMVVKIVVRPIAKLSEGLDQVQAAHPTASHAVEDCWRCYGCPRRVPG